MKLVVVGLGYVGTSLAVLISKKYEVIAVDIDDEKVKKINKRISPIQDAEIEKFLNNKSLKLSASNDLLESCKNSEYIIIATPTNYNLKENTFNTETVESVISILAGRKNKINIVIKSTVPMGFTEKMQKKYNYQSIFFSPEFLTESRALYDNLHPSRIIVGDDSNAAKVFGSLLAECSNKDTRDVPIVYMLSKEAEAVKLFSNTYLALRVSFFNELDTFSEVNSLSTKKVIEGVSLDPRIGNFYNNPSFGYGGYCLPKDTKQLLNDFKNIPNKIIQAVVDSNKTRKKFIVDSIIKKNPKIVGVYRLIMKEGSDNFRESAIIDIINMISEANIRVIIYEPLLRDKEFDKMEVLTNFDEFVNTADLIIANRNSDDLKSIKNKIYTRDIFQRN